MNDAPMPNPKSLTESTEGWTLMQLSEVVASRRDQPSYHVFSEANARGQIFNLGKDEQLRSMKYDGNVLLIPIEGRIKVMPERRRKDDGGRVTTSHQSGSGLLRKCCRVFGCSGNLDPTFCEDRIFRRREC